MQKLNNQLVLTREDHNYLTSLIKGQSGQTGSDTKNFEDLSIELKKAKLVTRDKFPHDVVRLNSKVTIKAEDKNEEIKLMLVTPDKANIKERKISVLAPIGTALIGFRQGQKIKWQVPAGNRTFTIMEVIN